MSVQRRLDSYRDMINHNSADMVSFSEVLLKHRGRLDGLDSRVAALESSPRPSQRRLNSAIKSDDNVDYAEVIKDHGKVISQLVIDNNKLNLTVKVLSVFCALGFFYTQSSNLVETGNAYLTALKTSGVAKNLGEMSSSFFHGFKIGVPLNLLGYGVYRAASAFKNLCCGKSTSHTRA